MQFLKTLFWVVLAVAAVIFAMRNWTPVSVALWGGLLVEAKLPVLLYGAFAFGFVPLFLYHRATRWRLTRRIGSHERTLADIRAADLPATAPAAVAPATIAAAGTPPVVEPASALAEPPAQS